MACDGGCSEAKYWIQVALIYYLTDNLSARQTNFSKWIYGATGTSCGTLWKWWIRGVRDAGAASHVDFFIPCRRNCFYYKFLAFYL